MNGLILTQPIKECVRSSFLKRLGLEKTDKIRNHENALSP